GGPNRGHHRFEDRVVPWRAEADVPRGVVERGDGLERTLGPELIDEDLMIELRGAELFERERGEERAIVVAALRVDLEEAAVRLRATRRGGRGLLELADRRGDVAPRDEELGERAARVGVARLELHGAG